MSILLIKDTNMYKIALCFFAFTSLLHAAQPANAASFEYTLNRSLEPADVTHTRTEGATLTLKTTCRHHPSGSVLISTTIYTAKKENESLTYIAKPSVIDTVIREPLIEKEFKRIYAAACIKYLAAPTDQALANSVGKIIHFNAKDVQEEAIANAQGNPCSIPILYAHYFHSAAP